MTENRKKVKDRYLAVDRQGRLSALLSRPLIAFGLISLSLSLAFLTTDRSVADNDVPLYVASFTSLDHSIRQPNKIMGTVSGKVRSHSATKTVTKVSETEQSQSVADSDLPGADSKTSKRRSSYDMQDESMLYVASDYMARGSAYLAKGDYAAALDFFTRANEIYERSGFHSGLASSFEGMADAASAMLVKDPAAIGNYYQEALWHLKHLGSERGEARLNRKYAESLAAEGDMEEAQRHYEQSLDYYRANEDKREMAVVYAQQCQNYLFANNLHQAEENCRLALDLFEQIGDTQGIKTVTQYLNLLSEMREP